MTGLQAWAHAGIVVWLLIEAVGAVVVIVDEVAISIAARRAARR